MRHSMNTTSDINYYILISPDRGDLDFEINKSRRLDFKKYLESSGRFHGDGYANAIGSWKGITESSYVLSAGIDETMAKETAENLRTIWQQDCVLIIRPDRSVIDSSGKELGRLKSLSREAARAREDWTYRPDLDTYFVIE